MQPSNNDGAAAAATAGGVGQNGTAGQRHWMMGREAFKRRMPHHNGIKALWETKWKFPCSKSLYPFHDGAYKDFEPVFEELIKNDINDPFDEAYTRAFLPRARELCAQADALALAAVIDHSKISNTGGSSSSNRSNNDATSIAISSSTKISKTNETKARASALYLRACALYRIARFPYLTTTAQPGSFGDDPAKREAWAEQKATYARAGQLWGSPLEEVEVPHVYRVTAGQVEEGEVIPVYVRVPVPVPVLNGDGKEKKVMMKGEEEEELVVVEEVEDVDAEAEKEEKIKWPVVVLMTGLDGYRPDNTVRCEEFLKRGWASVVVEIPGTADCPADPGDPTSPDRLWDSLLEWMARDGRFDMGRVLVWGLSSGGYYAVRIAHTHSDRLAGCVAQGAGCHYFFDPEWLEKADGHEYPFKLTPCMAQKHGFDSVEAYKAEAQKKFSLLETGILHKPSTRLLLVNGTQDGLMPIEDSLMLLQYGSVKEARLFPGALHMGYPDANASVYPWMEAVMASVKG